MTKLYLSGPMTGLPEFNYPAFREATKTLRDKGFDVFDPSEMFGGDSSRDKSEYMREDIKALLDCSLVVLLPGWENSEGAKLEVEVARQCNIPVKSIGDFL
jgi:hypothetical protein